MGLKESKMEDNKFLDDLDRGDLDCQLGNAALDNESQAYYTGYGARYVLEQMQSAGVLEQ
jgi:hypothetical protein